MAGKKTSTALHNGLNYGFLGLSIIGDVLKQSVCVHLRQMKPRDALATMNDVINSVLNRKISSLMYNVEAWLEV